MIITIDGPAGSGKSTISRLLAGKLDFQFLDTGATYRVVTYLILERHIPFQDIESINEILETLEIRFEGEIVFINDEDKTLEIRKRYIDEKVSEVAAMPNVRTKLVELQRKIASTGDFIAEGRDMGSVVFSNADYKFYLDAGVEERANRRLKQMEEKGESGFSFEEIKADIIKRDNYDRSREIAPLTIPKGAVIIDSSLLTIDEVVECIISEVRH